MFYPNVVFYFNLYIPLSPFLEIKNGVRNFKIRQTTQSKVASATPTWLPQHVETEPTISGKQLRSCKGQSDLLFLADEDVLWGNAKWSLGSLTVVASGEKFHQRILLANIPKFKHGIHLGRGLTERQLNALCPGVSHLRFTILNSEWPHWRRHSAHALSKTAGSFSKTSDDWNTATQHLNLLPSIWMSYFKLKFVLIFCRI